MPATTRQLLPDTCDVVDELARRFQTRTKRSGRTRAVGKHRRQRPRRASRERLEPSLARIDRGDCWVAADRRDGERLRRLAGRAVLVGDPQVTDVLSLDGHEVRLRRHVQAFFQGNRFLLRDLVANVDRPDRRPATTSWTCMPVSDSFLSAAAIVRGAHVTAVEGDRFAAADLVANAAATTGAVAPVHQSVETFAARHRRAPAC